MQSNFPTVKFLLVFLLYNVIIVANCYKEYDMAHDRLCGQMAKKRVIKLDYLDRSAMSVVATQKFDKWTNHYADFDCRFEILGISKDGIAAVIQRLRLRRNETTGECIDYIEFTPKSGLPSQKKCGYITSYENNAQSTFIDFRGTLSVLIHVDKATVNPDEKLELYIVFTAFKLCAKTTSNYIGCDDNVCIWKGFFHDKKINCPFGCKDEVPCPAINVIDKTNSLVGLMEVILPVVFLTLCALGCVYAYGHYRGFCSDSVTQAQMAMAGDCDLPSAPPAYSSDEKPPAYETLFPGP